MISNESKRAAMQPLLDKFETDEIRDYFLDMCEHIPDYMFTMPSSTSGKYHSKQQCQKYGQLIHEFLFAKILNYILDLKNVKEKFKSPIQRDLMRCAPVFHDAIKCGWSGSKYTVHEHPVLAADWIKTTKVEHDIDSKYKKYLADLCASHSGEWTTNKRSKVILPEPQTSAQLLIHICDILASRNDIIWDLPEGLIDEFEELL